jgi:hypothetical protein
VRANQLRESSEAVGLACRRLHCESSARLVQCGGDQRIDTRPFIAGQITGLLQFAAIAAFAVLRLLASVNRIGLSPLSHRRFDTGLRVVFVMDTTKIVIIN